MHRVGCSCSGNLKRKLQCERVMKFMVYFTTEMHKAVKETRDAMKGVVKAGKALQSRKRKGFKPVCLE